MLELDAATTGANTYFWRRRRPGLACTRLVGAVDDVVHTQLLLRASPGVVQEEREIREAATKDNLKHRSSSSGPVTCMSGDGIDDDDYEDGMWMDREAEWHRRIDKIQSVE